MSKFSSLSKYRVDGDTEVHPDQPDRLTPERHGVFLCFDQALATTGWALLLADERGWTVLDTGVHKTKPMAKTSLEDSFSRGELLNALIEQQLTDLIHHNDIEVVYEMPVVGPRKTRNAEAAPVAIMALRLACVGHDVPAHMVNVQQARKRLTGSSKADKKDVRAVVEEVVQVESMPYANEHTYDALGLGVAFTAATD